MAEIARSALFGQLNSLTYKALESAHGFCRLRENPYVEVSHWLHQILQEQDSDLHLIARRFEIDQGQLQEEMEKALSQLPRGATSVADFSPHLEDAAERGFVFGSLMFGDRRVRSGHILVALRKTPALLGVLRGISPSLAALPIDTLTNEFAEIVGASAEEQDQGPLEASSASAPGAQAANRGDGALAKYTADLTADAAEGRIDPIVGRDEEIRQVIDVLMRRRQNNPILTGEAGVGKTAVVEGLARRIADGDVPPPLRGVSLLSLDIGALSAGASMKGEFEKRLKAIIDEVMASSKPIILFIDEAHTLIGAGGQAGTGDAANLLKPALARGELRTVAATTWSEYKKYIEKDPALTRRFQTVKVDEPDDENAVAMMRAIAGMLERHHKVRISADALAASVILSRRYIPDRQLPDKAVSLLDTSCARVALSQGATPARLEAVHRQLDRARRELELLERESKLGEERPQQIDYLREEIERLTAERENVEARWAEEKDITDEILSLEKTLQEEAAEDAPDPVAAAERLRTLRAQLTERQGDDPLIVPVVDEAGVADVVSNWTGVPVGRLVQDEVQAILKLDETLKQRVVGQDTGLETIARRVLNSRAGLGDPEKPVGVFLLCGPSGVGKTETALALAETLYGGEQNIITLNMSEFQESHTVSTLKGAPPGYVGYGEGGKLTEAVRRRPYSVVLLDEVEKAHPDVHEVFFQVFDKGMMEDGEGRRVDFRNTLILLTSNVGDKVLEHLASQEKGPPPADDARTALRPALLDVFPAALLGRMVTVPYYPLSDEVLAKLIGMRLDRIARRARDAHGAEVTFSPDVSALIARRCTERESGGRAIDAIITNTLLPQMSEAFLKAAFERKQINAVEVLTEEQDFLCRFSYDEKESLA